MILLYDIQVINQVRTIKIVSTKNNTEVKLKVEKESVYLKDCIECKYSLEIKKELCSYCMAQKIIKGKWKLLIIWNLKSGKKRFSALSREIPATQASLTKQLRELERDGIIHREVYNVIPPKVEYSLTTMGEKFITVMDSMSNWGIEYFGAIQKS